MSTSVVRHPVVTLDQRIAALRDAIRYDRLIISRAEAERQLKALLAEKKGQSNA